MLQLLKSQFVGREERPPWCRLTEVGHLSCGVCKPQLMACCCAGRALVPIFARSGGHCLTLTL